MSGWGQIKRFYNEAAAVESDGACRIELDGKPVKTPTGADLIVEQRKLAEAMADEWAAQGEEVAPLSMPLCRLVATAIDRVGSKRQEVEDITLKFAETDLLCYWADNPPELIARHQEQWRPLLDWASDELGASLDVTAGISPILQPVAALDALRESIGKLDNLRLIAVSSIAAATGSLVLAFALERGRITAEQTFRIAVVDEHFQMEQWGEDWEAKERHERILSDIEESSRLLKLIG